MPTATASLQLALASRDLTKVDSTDSPWTYVFRHDLRSAIQSETIFTEKFIATGRAPATITSHPTGHLTVASNFAAPLISALRTIKDITPDAHCTSSTTRTPVGQYS